MSTKNAPYTNPGGAALTRHALFELRLQEMRDRGESVEDMSQCAPTISEGSYTKRSREEIPILMAKCKEIFGDFPNESPSERSRKRREAYEQVAERKVEEPGLFLTTSPPTARIVDTRPPESGSGSDCADLDEDSVVGANSSGKAKAKQNKKADAQPKSKEKPDPESKSSAKPSRHRDPLSGDIEQVPLHYESHNPAPMGLGTGSSMRLSTERRLLQEEMLDHAKFRPETRTLFGTFDMNAFADGPGNDLDIDADNNLGNKDKPTETDSSIPTSLPPHRVDGFSELGTYLASSSYVVSLGGPPLPDLKYGIIIVPIGEEELLFRGHCDHAIMPPELKQQAKSKECRKEQAQELREKAVLERARSGLEPEIDVEDYEFYQLKRLSRKIIAPHKYNSPLVGSKARRAGGYDDRPWAEESSQKDWENMSVEERLRASNGAPNEPMEMASKTQQVHSEGGVIHESPKRQKRKKASKRSKKPRLDRSKSRSTKDSEVPRERGLGDQELASDRNLVTPRSQRRPWIQKSQQNLDDEPGVAPEVLDALTLCLV